jgi:hypothetical protein
MLNHPHIAATLPTSPLPGGQSTDASPVRTAEIPLQHDQPSLRHSDFSPFSVHRPTNAPPSVFALPFLIRVHPPSVVVLPGPSDLTSPSHLWAVRSPAAIAAWPPTYDR